MIFVKTLRQELSQSHSLAIAFLVAITLLCTLPGFFSIPPTDRDESRFAQASKQMVESGDYINIRFQDEARNKKPVGIYWLQAAAVKLSGFGADAPIWVYRIPSLLGAIGAVLLTYWALLPLMRREEAFYAALLLSCCFLLGVEARLAKTDAVLLGVATAAMGALIRVFRNEKSDAFNAYLFWFSAAAGFLIKGPITLLVAALAAITFSFHRRSVSWLKNSRPLSGALLFLLLVAPWFVAILRETNGAFLSESFGRDMLAKVMAGQEMHWAPPGTYFMLVWVTFFPAACFLAALLPKIWRRRRQPALILLFAWALPVWLVFELIPTKLPHYVLPLYPALAGLVALSAGEQGWRFTEKWQRFCLSGLIWFPAFLLSGAALLLWWSEHIVDIVALALVPVLVAIGVYAFRASRNDGKDAVLLAALLTMVLSFGVYQRIVPQLQEIWLSPRLTEAARTHIACADPQLASAGYHEPSLVFLTRKNIALTGGVGAADFLMQGGCRAAFVDGLELQSFMSRLAEKKLQASRLALIEGRNINGGHGQSIGLWELAGSR